MNALIIQSGGPTAAINATLAGIVERAMTSSAVNHIYGALHGIKGVIADDLVLLDSALANPAELVRLSKTPAAALGSCRMKLPDPAADTRVYETIFATLAKHDIGYFVCIGGNDSMDTVMKLSAYAESHGITNVSIMGAPKTIDNDLNGMDHSPGFGSAARYIAVTFSEIWADCRVYDIPAVTIVEVMGRHVGWLAAASAISADRCSAPQLIYLPEIPFDEKSFLEDVRKQLTINPAVLVCVSEGIRYADKKFVAEGNGSQKDNFGHVRLTGAARVLEALVAREIGCKVRSIELNLMQRCSGHIASQVDLTESRLLGMTALDRALKGESGRVSVLRRILDEPYCVEYDTVPVREIANLEKAVPREWINERGNFVTEDMLDYLLPLIGGSSDTQHGLPPHTTLY